MNTTVLEDWRSVEFHGFPKYFKSLPRCSTGLTCSEYIRTTLSTLAAVHECFRGVKRGSRADTEFTHQMKYSRNGMCETTNGHHTNNNNVST